MAEYIEREALDKALTVAAANDKDKNRRTWAKAICVLHDLPAADVAPVVHGRWIGAPLCGNDNCKCSECGSWNNIHANLRGEIMQKYCPNCGARMDGDDDG